MPAIAHELDIEIDAQLFDRINRVERKDRSRRMNSDEVQSLLAERQKRWTPPSLEHPSGILKRYASRAVSAIKGAYLA